MHQELFVILIGLLRYAIQQMYIMRQQPDAQNVQSNFSVNFVEFHRERRTVEFICVLIPQHRAERRQAARFFNALDTLQQVVIVLSCILCVCVHLGMISHTGGWRWYLHI